MCLSVRFTEIHPKAVKQSQYTFVCLNLFHLRGGYFNLIFNCYSLSFVSLGGGHDEFAVSSLLLFVLLCVHSIIKMERPVSGKV